MGLGLSPFYRVNRGDTSSPACKLEVAWQSPWREFATSLVDFFAGARPAKDCQWQTCDAFQVEWVCARLPGRAFAASSVWHLAAVLILILPIWGFLPQPEHTLPPLQIEVSYVPQQDLPHISLAAPRPKPSPAARRIRSENRATSESGADSYHPRQTILSIPVEVTHPRQTLIEPDAPKTAPKIDVELPNMVEWAAPATPRPQLQFSPTAAAPAMRKRVVRDIAVPELPNAEKNPAALNMASTAIINPQPQLAMSATSAAVATQRQARTDATAAPEIGSASGSDDLHRLIALSAAPGPAAPPISVPQENLAARVSISPEGRRPGTPGGSREGGAAGDNVPSGGIADASSLPAAVSVSGGNSRGGGIAPSAGRAEALNLRPAAPDFTAPARKGPSVVGTIAPNTAPEKILSGKEVYTLDINLPNLTSVTGSWIVNFAQLEEADPPLPRPQGRLSGPIPVEKIDPKYPPQLIKDHVEGQVVLYAIIRKDGSVSGIQLVHGVDPELDKDAIEAFARWKFRPGSRDGVPIDLEAVVYIPFRYRPPAP